MGPGRASGPRTASRVASRPPRDGLPDPEVTIPVREGEIRGDLVVPPAAGGAVVFAHGSGSGRSSPRNRRVAFELQRAGLSTLLLDLLTDDEQRIDERTRQYRFDIPRLAGRLVEVIDRLGDWPGTRDRPVGLYGASTGGAAALIAAAARPEAVRAIVLRGARSDLADPDARRVRAPALFLVGELDPEIRALNQATCSELAGPNELVVVPRASHLFEEPGALEEVARLARDWFVRHLRAAG